MITAYDSIVVRTACKVLVPFVQVFALYVVFHGHESPGGGFQGGAILGASIILTRFTQRGRLSQRYAPGAVAVKLGALGVLVYAAFGAFALLHGGAFLDYGYVPLPGLPPDQIRAMGILGVEIGVAIAVTGIMVSIFDDLAPQTPERPESHPS
jgi:multicomponent Na+:H+ antiporter subunit B